MKTKEDIRRIAEIADRLRELGVPENVCKQIDVWNKKQEEDIMKRLVTAERL